MNLTFNQICAITQGAARILEDTGDVRFFRLTDEQYAAFAAQNTSISNTACGIKLVFRTNSRSLRLQALLEGNIYWWPLVSFDVQVDDRIIGHLDNFSHIENFVPKFEEKLPLGPVEKTFDLGEGEKTVTVHLPWCHRFLLRQISLDDGAFVEPVQKKKLLMYGDSITQGYCATRPSLRLAAKVAAGLDMEECNRAMAGSTFLPDVAAAVDPVTPDLITVSYGSNDWGQGHTAEQLAENCRQFLRNIRKNYPDIPIMMVSPVFRFSFECCNPCIDYETVTETLRQTAAEFDNLHFICGVDLVPHEETMFFDGLHPNDQGFEIYADNLIAQIKSHL